MVFVLLLACPVKSGIRSFAGLPAKTEQGVNKGGRILFENNPEQCANSETAETVISQTVAVDTNNLLPAVLFTAIFLFLPGVARSKEQARPLYGNVKITGALPIFLQHRKLII